MIDNIDTDSLGVEFEGEEEKFSQRKFPQRVVSFMANWLVKRKIAKTTEQANMFLIAISILVASLSIFVLYFSAFYYTPEDDSTLLVPQDGIYVDKS